MNPLKFLYVWKLRTEFRFFIHTRYLMITVIRYVTPCRLEDRHERFGGMYCLNLQGKTHFHISFPKMGFEDSNTKNINMNLIVQIHHFLTAPPSFFRYNSHLKQSTVNVHPHTHIYGTLTSFRESLQTRCYKFTPPNLINLTRKESQ